MCIEKREFLWKVIGRLDYYIGSTNYKSAVVVAYNAFVSTGIILEWQKIILIFDGYPKLITFSSFLLFLSALASLISLFFIFRTIIPFLKSPESPQKYTSLIFFGHIIKYDNPEHYLKHVSKIDNDKELVDLSNQTYSLAQAANDKFKFIKLSMRFIIFGQLLPFGIILLLKLFILLWTIL